VHVHRFTDVNVHEPAQGVTDDKRRRAAPGALDGALALKFRFDAPDLAEPTSSAEGIPWPKGREDKKEK